MNTSINAETLSTLINSAYMAEMLIDFVKLEDNQTITIEKLGNSFVVSLHVLPGNCNFKKAKLLAKTSVTNESDLLDSINNMLMNYNGGVIADEVSKELLTEYHSDMSWCDKEVDALVNELMRSETYGNWFDVEVVRDTLSAVRDMFNEVYVDDERYHLPS